MKLVSIQVLVLIGGMVFISCKEKTVKEKFVVSGKIVNSNAKTVYLEEVPIGARDRMVVDSSVLGKDGEYKLKSDATEPTILNLRLDDSNLPAASVVNDVPSMTLDIQFSKENNQFAEKYEVKGSKASEEIKSYMYDFNNHLQELFITGRSGDSLRAARAPDSVIAPLMTKQKGLVQYLKSSMMDAVQSASNPASAMFIFGYYQSAASNERLGLEGLDETSVNELIKIVAAKFPNHSRLASIRQSIEAQEQQMAATTWVGKMAPEIALPDLNGKVIKLSSYKGKYVLVDFWASWCGPCRYENPNVVSAYSKFKDKNFDILGVSLDERKDQWVKAIKDDNLSWKQVSDLKRWESEVVAVFGFGEVGIPYNILVDPQGKIIAERLRGPALDAKLAEVLK
jgi:peroxiredoxin